MEHLPIWPKLFQSGHRSRTSRTPTPRLCPDSDALKCSHMFSCVQMIPQPIGVPRYTHFAICTSSQHSMCENSAPHCLRALVGSARLHGTYRLQALVKKPGEPTLRTNWDHRVNYAKPPGLYGAVCGRTSDSMTQCTLCPGGALASN